jgi:hypothetical protein
MRAGRLARLIETVKPVAAEPGQSERLKGGGPVGAGRCLKGQLSAKQPLAPRCLSGPDTA